MKPFAMLKQGPEQDPWEPELTRRTGHHRLTSVEVTVTNRCNLRCRHCAVGETLVLQEPERIPLAALLRRLDELPDLRTLSITGGEPSENHDTLTSYVLPLLRYAKERGAATQINTNLTYDRERYERIAPYVDTFHISWNYTGVEAFHRTAWGHGRNQVALAASERLFTRLVENTSALARAGCFLSAETMINRETAPHLGAMNRFLADLGCGRHEVHPMYPVDWAKELPVLTLDEYRAAVDRLLDERDPSLWLLFGTFPFLPCSPSPADQALLARVRKGENLSIRNCPDGRNRVNINAFTGEVFVTDFAEIPALGSIHHEPLEAIFERWQEHEAFAPFNCYCPEVGCTGPNLIVANLYHAGVDFRNRRAAL